MVVCVWKSSTVGELGFNQKNAINNTKRPKIAINRRRCFGGNFCITDQFSGFFIFFSPTGSSFCVCAFALIASNSFKKSSSGDIGSLADLACNVLNSLTKSSSVDKSVTTDCLMLTSGMGSDKEVRSKNSPFCNDFCFTVVLISFSRLIMTGSSATLSFSSFCELEISSTIMSEETDGRLSDIMINSLLFVIFDTGASTL